MGMGFVLAQQMGGMVNPTAAQQQGVQPLAGTPMAPPPIPTPVQYFYVQEGKQAGPVTFEQLKMLFANRTINKEGLVWKQGMDNWKPLKEVEELKSFLGGNTPPPIPTA